MRIAIPNHKKHIAILLTVLFLLSGCLGRMITRPTVTIQSIEVTGLSLAGAALTFRVELENPNGFGVTITAFTYSIYLNDHPIAKGETTEPVTIERRSAARVSLPLKTSFREIEKGLKFLIGSDTADYRIEGSLTVQSFFGRLEFPYSRSGTISIKH